MPAAGRNPPLWTWVVATATTLLFVLAAANLHRLAWLAPKYDRWTSYNLQRLGTVPADALHVVAIGTSKTLYAIEFDDIFVRRLRVPGRKLVFHRITASGPSFADLEPALVEVARRPPDLLLFEEDLLIYHRGDQSVLDAGLQQMRTNILLVRERLGKEIPDLERTKNHGREKWPLESRCLQRKTPDALRAYAGFASRWRILREDERAGYLDFLKPMQAAGTRVVLVKLPRSPSAEPMVPDKLKQAGSELREQLVAGHRVLYWEPGPIQESMYCDQGHFNQNGREFFSNWLATRVQAELVGR